MNGNDEYKWKKGMYCTPVPESFWQKAWDLNSLCLEISRQVHTLSLQAPTSPHGCRITNCLIANSKCQRSFLTKCNSVLFLFILLPPLTNGCQTKLWLSSKTFGFCLNELIIFHWFKHVAVHDHKWKCVRLFRR